MRYSRQVSATRITRTFSTGYLRFSATYPRLHYSRKISGVSVSFKVLIAVI